MLRVHRIKWRLAIQLQIATNRTRTHSWLLMVATKNAKVFGLSIQGYCRKMAVQHGRNRE